MTRPNNLTSSLPTPLPLSCYAVHDGQSCEDVTRLSSVSLHYYKRAAQEVFHSTRGVGVSRPLPKHIEEDLTTRIGNSIRKSIENACNEKILKSQIRVDRMRDEIDSLATETERFHKVYRKLSRSVASQEQGLQLLKHVVVVQKNKLEKIEHGMVQDVEWKVTIKADIDELKNTYHILKNTTNSQLFHRLVKSHF